MSLTPAMEDYLEAVLIVAKTQIEVRSVDIARQLDVSKPSVWRAMTVLKDGGFLTMDDHGFLWLTDLGQETAKKIYERHCFFTDRLIAAGIDPAQAEKEACRIEHAISEESFQILKDTFENHGGDDTSSYSSLRWFSCVVTSFYQGSV